MWLRTDDLDPTASHRVIVKHTSLVDADFNPHGIAEAVVWPREDDGTWTAEAAVWNDPQDCFESKTIKNVKMVMPFPEAPDDEL